MNCAPCYPPLSANPAPTGGAEKYDSVETKHDGLQSTHVNENMLFAKRSQQPIQNKGEAIRNADYFRKNPATCSKQRNAIWPARLFSDNPAHAPARPLQ
jgi:hypothetical protein